MEQWLESLKYVEEPNPTVADLKGKIDEIHEAFRRNGNAKIACGDKIYFIHTQNNNVCIKCISKEVYELPLKKPSLIANYSGSRRLFRIERFFKKSGDDNKKNNMIIDLKKRREWLRTRLTKESFKKEFSHIERLLETYDSVKYLD